jgi:predicted methyltransferase
LSGVPGRPLLTRDVVSTLRATARAGAAAVECSLDLGRSTTRVLAAATGFTWQAQAYPYPEPCRERTVYHWTGETFEPVARYRSSLIKLVPTEWGPPTFEIDGIKMLPTARVSPYLDAEVKVALIKPAGKTILDTCGGLGYFAAWCLAGGAERVLSFEKNPDVLWLRSLNPWSPAADARLALAQGDIGVEIRGLPSGSLDAVLHDPPRFGIAGELYAQEFYDELARTLKRRGRLFHYTGTPNRKTSGRDVPAEVSRRLRTAGFHTELTGDGVLAIRT